MHDGIEVERRGKPAAAVLTDRFVVTAKVRAEACGIPDYPFVVVPHPLGRLSDDLVWARAEGALPRVIALLLGERDTP